MECWKVGMVGFDNCHFNPGIITSACPEEVVLKTYIKAVPFQ
jgi:hypothetical protein